MNKLHLALVAGLLAAAAMLGTVAATHTVSLGAAHTRAGNAGVARRTKQLQRFEASLRRTLKKKPPALPKVPAAQSRGVSASAPRVIYRRPPAIVIVHHTHHGDDGGGETEAAGGGGGGGD